MKMLIKSGAWVAPLGDVAKYLKERQHTRVYIRQKGNTRIVSLEDNLSNDIYNVPLTLKIRTNWESVKVTGSCGDGVYDIEDGYLLVDVYPDSTVIIRRRR